MSASSTFSTWILVVEWSLVFEDVVPAGLAKFIESTALSIFEMSISAVAPFITP